MDDSVLDFDGGNVNVGGEITTDASSTRTQTANDEPDVYTTELGNIDTFRSDSTDEVDIQKLVSEPSLSDIRWLYRNTWASTIVDKPVEDAFKNGFDVKNEPTNSVEPLLKQTEWVSQYKFARKQARRDGFSLMYLVLNDNGDGPHQDPADLTVSGIEGIKVWTIDDMAHEVEEEAIRGQVPPKYRLPESNLETELDFKYEVRKSGIVVSRDLMDISYGDPIGYVKGPAHDPTFVHSERVIHLVENPEVSGDYHPEKTEVIRANSRAEEWLGKWEGDSELQASYHLLKAVFKGDWATMQTLFRYSSPFFGLTLPERAEEEDLESAREEFTNLNAKSEGVFPTGYELEVHETDGSLEPEGYFDPIFDQICAAHEMTRSVIFGTQSGTVSGSDSDQQNYLNQVNRFRHTKAEDDLERFVRRLSQWDKSTVPNLALGYRIKWEPLYKLSEVNKVEAIRTAVNAATMASEQFYISPQEGRELLDQLLGERYDLDLSEDLDPEDFEMLEEVQIAQMGAESLEEKMETRAEAKGNPQMKAKGSGVSRGQTESQEQPNTE